MFYVLFSLFSAKSTSQKPCLETFMAPVGNPSEHKNGLLKQQWSAEVVI